VFSAKLTRQSAKTKVVLHKHAYRPNHSDNQFADQQHGVTKIKCDAELQGIQDRSMVELYQFFCVRISQLKHFPTYFLPDWHLEN
jgi:hypothetical protein